MSLECFSLIYKTFMFGNLFLKNSRQLVPTSLQKKSIYDLFFSFFKTKKSFDGLPPNLKSIKEADVFLLNSQDLYN